MPKQVKVIGSLQRALNILDLFDEHHLELGTTDIARAMQMPKSTIAGLVSTLELNGYLDQNPSTRKYRLGFKLVERAGVLLNQFTLREVAAPFLQELRDQCNESINMAVRDGGYVVYIERIYGTNMLGMRSEIGKRERIHSTALGKAILSHLTAGEIQALLAQLDFKPVTPRTITSPAAFLSELENTRQRGFAIDDEENELGGRCVAAPVLNYKDEPVAAVSISVPLQRFPDSKINEFGKLVLETALQISRKLGSSAFSRSRSR